MGLYRPTVVRRRKNGTKYRQKTGQWWGKFYDHSADKYRSVPLKTADKAAARILFSQIQRTAADESVRSFAKHMARPLSEHVDEWHATLSAKRTQHHANASKSYVLTVFNGCGFTRWGDIFASEVETFIADLVNEGRGGRGRRATHRRLSARARNEYLRACKQFARWMVRDRRSPENPLAHLQRENTQTDRRVVRRALTPDELRWLLTVTRNRADCWRMTGHARCLLYLLATETGLRSSELRSLRWSSFDLNPDTPSVTIAAAYSKNRREDTLPLRPAAAKLLTAWREETTDQDSGDGVFNMPHVANVAAMLRADMDAARRG